MSEESIAKTSVVCRKLDNSMLIDTHLFRCFHVNPPLVVRSRRTLHSAHPVPFLLAYFPNANSTANARLLCTECDAPRIRRYRKRVS